MLEANVFSDLDKWGAFGLLNMLCRVTRTNTWIDIYEGIEQILEIDPKDTVAEVAIQLEEDPALANKIFPVMALLNASARGSDCSKYL